MSEGRIGEFLRELDLAEGRSTGISKILRVMRANGSPAPVFDSDDDRSYFLIRLPAHAEAVTEETPVKTPDRIIQLLGDYPDMTLAEVASRIGKSRSAVERAASKLVKSGRLKYVGPQKGGHWVVEENG